MKVLLIQQKMIGDVLLTSMLAQCLKNHYEQVEVHYMIHDHTEAVVLNNPFIDELILFESARKKNLTYLLSMGRQLKKQQYDVIIDAYAKNESALLTFLSKAPKRISFEKGYLRFCYTDTVRRCVEVATNVGRTIEDRLRLLGPLGIAKNYTVVPKIYVKEEEVNYAKDIFKKHGIDERKKTFMFSVIGSEPGKTYPNEYMAKLIDWVVDTVDCNVLLNYFPKQLSQATEIYQLCNESTKQNIYFELLGGNLREFISIMHLCDAIIGNDGGAINMAKSLNKPSFIIFSPFLTKESWNTFEDGKYHITVHLKDFKPQLLQEYTDKGVRKNVQQLYLEFNPEMFKEMLLSFVMFVNNNNLSLYQLEESVLEF